MYSKSTKVSKNPELSKQFKERDNQGCQIFLDATKSPNGHKMYKMAVIYSKWPKNIPTFFHYKALEN
jgi:hypothetical protein